MPIKTSEWHQVDKLFSDLLDLEPADRAKQLDTFDSTDPAMARRLRRLLGHMERESGLEGLAEKLSAVGDCAHLSPDTTIGSWRIVRRIGGGGMADVYEAERNLGEGRQRAALKILSLALSNDTARAGFAREIAILARLEDPCLSRLIDAGKHSDGRPWLAMEYIEGATIDKAFDEQKLPIRQRVELFIEIAWAVDNAHRELIVHRDIKPGNILLDQNGRPRVLDFGIAKLLEPGSIERDVTRTTSQAYTLSFTSPEQLEGKSTGIAGDVYQLGLLLHLLLVGERAFAGKDDNPFQLINAMKQGPDLSSKRVSTQSNSVATSRSASLRQLQHQIKGDLDSIIIQALAYDPHKRYRGAGDLALDLQRWLDGDAVQARSGTFGYSTMRAVRKNWVAVSAGAMIALAFSIYLGLVLVQRDRLQVERDRTQNVLDAMTTVLSSADPYRPESDTLTVRELVQRTADDLMVETKVDPEVQVLLMERFSLISASDRDHDRQELLLQGALKLVEEHNLDRHLRGRLLLNLAIAQASLRRFDLASESLNRAWPDFNEKDYFRARLHEAQLKGALGDQSGGAERMLALLEELPDGEDYRSVRANAHNSLGLSMRAMGRYEDAIGHFRQALVHAPDRTPEDADLVAIIRGNAATALAVQRRYLEADQEFREVIAWRARTLGDDHPSVAITTTTWTPLLLRTLRFESAWNELSSFEQAVLDQLTGYRRQILQFNLARAGLYTNRQRESIDLLLDAASPSAIDIDTVSSTDVFTLNVLAWTLFEIGAHDEAVALAQLLQTEDDAPDQMRWLTILLLSPGSPISAEQRSELRERVMSDHCAATELQALELAVSAPDSPDLSKMTLDSDCDGPRAARMRLLGLRWQPDWDGQFDPEPYQSPLITRIKASRFATPVSLSADQAARFASLMAKLRLIDSN